MKITNLALLAAAAVLLTGCKKDEPVVSGEPETTTVTTTTGGGETPTPTPPTPSNGKLVGATSDLGDKPALPGEEVAVIETSMGRIVARFYNDKAPKHVANFKKLANEKFYDGTKFHRVIPGFMIQGGDPNTKDSDPTNDGSGGPAETVKAEFNDVPHTRGILSMARSQDPDSAGSQFFIMHGDNSGLDGQYTVFGHVIEGMDVVDKIVQSPTVREIVAPKDQVVMKSVRIVKAPVK